MTFRELFEAFLCEELCACNEVAHEAAFLRALAVVQGA